MSVMGGLHGLRSVRSDGLRIALQFREVVLRSGKIAGSQSLPESGEIAAQLRICRRGSSAVLHLLGERRERLLRAGEIAR
jgi:hypothetical protein